MAGTVTRSRLRVFLSSTYEDLRPYAHAAEDLLARHVEVDQFKHWEASGRPSVSECRDRVRRCQALVVLAGPAYGWIPGPADGGDGRTSITRFEVRWAREKPMSVLPYFIQDPSLPVETSAEASRLQAEFVAELQATLGKPVTSVEAFRESLQQSILALIEQYQTDGDDETRRIGRRDQGRYTEFLDRETPRAALTEWFADGHSRGAVIVGKGGFGKSALANYVADQLQMERTVRHIVHLNSAPGTPVTPHELFDATMEVAGRPKIAYEGSWAALSSNRPRLIEVLLDVYRGSAIVLVFDAFEHNLDAEGGIRSEVLSAFLQAFLESAHGSKLLLTSRRFPAFSTTAAAALREVELLQGLPVAEGVSLLLTKRPGALWRRERVEAAVKSVDGVPYAVERMASILGDNRALDVGSDIVRVKTIEDFVALAHRSLGADARLVLQARSVFDEPVDADALSHVLDGVMTPAAFDAALAELAQGSFLRRDDRDGRLGLHELDQQAGYGSIGSERGLDRRQLHARAAEYYARRCQDRDYWFQWASFDDLASDVQRFRHLVRAGQPLAAAESFSASKVEFLNYSGHVDVVHDLFDGLDVGAEATPGLLVTRYALADRLAILGPYDRAIDALEDVIGLARTLGDTRTEISATYELGTAYRYTGRTVEALSLFRSVTERLQDPATAELRAYYLYGHSLACAYAGLYAEAIRVGLEQVRYGRRSGKAEFVSRGNSNLCLPYYVIGMAAEAAACAESSARAFVDTPREYLVGFIENVHGLALHALGRTADALAALVRAGDVGRRTWQRRVEGLSAFNRAWLLYERDDLSGGLAQIQEAIGVFSEISKPDENLSHCLREAMECARETDRRYEAEALWRFVTSDYVNADLIRRVAVAERIVALDGRGATGIKRQAAEHVASAHAAAAAVRAEFED
jgi:tetratricopeptide (TPR) repeat protein